MERSAVTDNRNANKRNTKNLQVIDVKIRREFGPISATHRYIVKLEFLPRLYWTYLQQSQQGYEKKDLFKPSVHNK